MFELNLNGEKESSAESWGKGVPGSRTGLGDCQTLGGIENGLWAPMKTFLEPLRARGYKEGNVRQDDLSQ